MNKILHVRRGKGGVYVCVDKIRESTRLCMCMCNVFVSVRVSVSVRVRAHVSATVNEKKRAIGINYFHTKSLKSTLI